MESCFVFQLDLKLKDRLQKDLEEQGFEILHPAHTVFSAKKKKLTCTLYESGKLVVQGKEKEEFIAFYLEPEILGKLTYTHPELDLNLTPRIGMDEAGKGDFFGPLCVAAIFAEGEKIKELLTLGVKDSKKLSDSTILSMSEKIMRSYPYTVIRLFPGKYNELHAKFKNLNRLLAWAHTAALEHLVKKTGCTHAVLDQFASPYVMERMLKQKKLDVHLVQTVRGEEADIVVAAASILARSGFLDGMKKLSGEIEYELPKGASQQVIKAGRELVKKWGPDILNRISKTHFKTKTEILVENQDLE